MNTSKAQEGQGIVDYQEKKDHFNIHSAKLHHLCLPFLSTAATISLCPAGLDQGLGEAEPAVVE